MPTHQLLVEMLHREVAVEFPIKRVHARQLALRRPARRYLAYPPIAQALDPILIVADTQPAEVPPRHPQQFSSLLSRQSLTAVQLKRLFETHHKNLP
jgi:hypothetical protein